MKLSILFTLFLSMNAYANQAQENNELLPYRVIPDAPASYNEGTVVARMIDGLGFRYYWASEGLRKEDLSYRPSPEARTSEETIDHVLGLSTVILNSAIHEVNAGNDFSELNFEEKRKLTLNNLKKAADIFRKGQNLNEFTVVFKGKNGNNTFPFWNQINGPIEDAIWHCGQIVSLRRASGNPFNPKVSVFMGTVKE